MGINEQDLLQLECLLHLQFYQQRFELKLRKWSNHISEVHKTLRTSLTILLSSSKQKLLNQTLSGISVRRLLQTPFYMWNYFLIAQILIQSIRRKHQKPVLRTKTMVVQKGTACNVGITANKITPKPFQQPTVPFWLPSTTPMKRLVAHVIDLTAPVREHPLNSRHCPCHPNDLWDGFSLEKFLQTANFWENPKKLNSPQHQGPCLFFIVSLSQNH